MKGARFRRFAVATAVAIGALGLWAFVLEPSALTLRRQRLVLPKWPAACSGLRVVLVADLHTGSPFNGLAKLDRVVRTIQGARPDLIVIAGDFLILDVPGGSFVPPALIANAVGKLAAPLGVFAVLGNHDWWVDAEKVRVALEGHGVPVLEDRAVRLTSGDCDFWLAGVGDLWEGRHDIGRALAAVPSDAAVLLLTHNPDLFPAVPSSVALTLAGHTHGGQVYLPLLGRPVVPSNYGERYAIGHVEEGDKHLFVTPGVGTSILPVRFLVPPEVSVLELDASTAGPLAGK